MPLSDIQLVPRTRDRQLAGKLMRSWRHVEDILRLKLPRRFDAKGVAKLYVVLDIDMHEAKPFSVTDNIAQVALGAFDPTGYFALTPAERARTALKAMSHGLKELCKRVEVDASPLDAAVVATAETGFKMTWEYSKLCKWHPGRRLRGEVLVTYRDGGTDVELAVTERSAGRVVRNRKVSGESWRTVWFYWFRSRWADLSFIVEGRTGAETARLDDVSSLVERAVQQRPAADGTSRRS